MAVFIVLWSCLFTTKLRFVIRHNLGHTMHCATRTWKWNWDQYLCCQPDLKTAIYVLKSSLGPTLETVTSSSQHSCMHHSLTSILKNRTRSCLPKIFGSAPVTLEFLISMGPNNCCVDGRFSQKIINL
jgi:hypothetical protein